MYKIEYVESVQDDLTSISKSNKEQIRKAIEKKLGTNPIEFGKPLQYSLKGLRRLRVGDYRVVFRIEEEDKTVLIIKSDIAPRFMNEIFNPQRDRLRASGP